MNTNLLTGSFVGGRNKREKGKVIQIKAEKRFIHKDLGYEWLSLCIWSLNC